jgi:ATP-dependent exoDNAse (exonuclease V) alpha subunit
MEVSIGDRLLIRRNDRKAGLVNGDVLTVRQIVADGTIHTHDGATIPSSFRDYCHGYVVTSHASQGKTVDRVFIGQSARSFAASSREQFYVSVSRAKEQAIVYTDDKQALLEAVSRADDRMTATELVREKASREKALTIQRGAAERQEEPPPSLELADHA